VRGRAKLSSCLVLKAVAGSAEPVPVPGRSGDRQVNCERFIRLTRCLPQLAQEIGDRVSDLGAAETLTEALDYLTPLGLEEVAVGVRGDPNRAVAQHLGDHLQVVAEIDQHRGEAVA
jgi:hypothetical protein